MGYREGYLETGYTFRPTTGLIRRLRTYVLADCIADREATCSRNTCRPALASTARWGTFVRIRYAWDRARAGEGKRTLPRNRLIYTITSAEPRRTHGRAFRPAAAEGPGDSRLGGTQERAVAAGHAQLGEERGGVPGIGIFKDARNWLLN